MMVQLNLKHSFRDLEHAKDHIHFQYYIIRLDNLGKRILEVLIRKAKQGVQVRLLYDDMGSRGLHKRHFKELIRIWWSSRSIFPFHFPTHKPSIELPKSPKNRCHRWTNRLYWRF